MMAPNREKQMVHTSSSELSLKKVSLYFDRFRGEEIGALFISFHRYTARFATIKSMIFIEYMQI